MNVTCATYNILHGYHRAHILKNIRFLVQEGADVVCLQEAEVRFEKYLRELLAEEAFAAWDVSFAHAGLGGNVATIWNTTKLSFKDAQTVMLPKLRVAPPIPRLAGLMKKINRVALVTHFEVDGRTLQVVNVHLAWEGGARHRLRQLKHLREELMRTAADFRIVTGDFNTIGARPLRARQERGVERTLGAEFRNAFPKLPWTYDTSFIDPEEGLQFMATLSRAGLRFRRRLDYMFAQDLSVIEARMHDLPGSDHRPLIATFGKGDQAQHAGELDLPGMPAEVQ